MHFVVVGLSHKTAPLEMREKLALSEEEIPRVLASLLECEDIQEGFLLSTCNRVEAYLVCKHVQRAGEAARKVLAEFGKMSEAQLAPHLYVRNSEVAVAHLFRVASSLDSMVVGEPQISGQVKEAYTQAVAGHATGTYLNKLIHKALNVSKKIRTETAIGRHPVSVSYAAVLLAERIFGNLSGTTVLLVGAGEMGALAARHLAERHVRHIKIANRTGEKAAELTQEISQKIPQKIPQKNSKMLSAEVIPFGDVPARLHEADIVVASTASENYVITETHVREAMHRRRNRPMFFIDIAVPRNVDPAVNQIENVYLYDIDHLQGIVEANLKEREKESKKAEALIEHEVKGFLEYIGQMEVSPTIHQLSKKFDLIRTSEVEKYLSKLPPEQREARDAIDACTKAIVNKILHEPIILMKTEEAKEGGPKYSEILKKLFGLESE